MSEFCLKPRLFTLNEKFRQSKMTLKSDNAMNYILYMHEHKLYSAETSSKFHLKRRAVHILGKSKITEQALQLIAAKELCSLICPFSTQLHQNCPVG